MKKIAVFLAAIAVSVSVLADPPTKAIDWFGQGKEYTSDDDAQARTGIRGTNRTLPTPITPATLLLLGLGGAVVGGKVIRNRRKE